MDCPPALYGFQARADKEGGPTPLRDSTPCRPKVSPPPHSLVKNFPKRGRKRMFWNVFSKICLRCRKFGRNRVFLVLWESSENQFSRHRKNFENTPPFEKILDPSLISRHFYTNFAVKKMNLSCSENSTLYEALSTKNFF